MDRPNAGGLLVVHAHPDDESITTGATMAHYAARGVPVTLLTCTLGEQGEILAPELAQLEAARADQLGGYRLGELATAMRELGVTDHRFLGGAGRFRDSGMIGDAANAHPRAFVRAAAEPEVFDAAVAAATDVICEVRPQVVVTYDDNGDYGHPDHVMAHRVAMAAIDRAADGGHRVAKVYWTATPRGGLEREFAELAAAGTPFDVADVAELPFGIDDGLVTATVDASEAVGAKRAALAAHRTQITVHGDHYALSNNLGRVISGIEHFRLVRGDAGPDRDPAGRERDLFSGLDVA